ncbi:divergent polysaccharide deacetylase family protein [Yoonia sp. 208BN28-4]|uniref:divergent polysaccharide deacetylase family protein n=1 Tax=Yoonia sp. 208BN28-4 TaxID=3126505 RepID=UPI00309B803E
MKGLLSGGAWGVVIGGLAVSAASLVSEQPAGNAPPAAPQVSAPQTADQDVAQSAPLDQPVDSEASAEPATTTQRVVAPQIETQGIVADTAPANQPDLAVIADVPDAPEPAAAPQLALTPEDPVLPNPQSVAPQVPLAEDDLIVSTVPAAPPAPVVVEVPDVVAEDTTSEVTDDVAEAPDTTTTIETPDALETPEGVDVADTAVIDTAPETAEAPEGLTPPDAPTAPDTATAEQAATPAPVTPEPEPEEVAAAPSEPAPEPTTDAPAVVTIVAEPTTGLPTGDSGVRVNRLGATPEEAPEEEVAATEDAVDPDAPAIERYGLRAENPDNKPTVAVVLIDDGSFASAVPALAGVPFPVTVMLNPSSPDAAEKMVAYRAAGIEVGVLAALPDGAQPSDVEVFFEAAFATLPETVAVLDAGNAGLQSGDNALIAQSIAAVAEDGRGLITISQGLNSTVREAAKAGVPTGTVYRDLDSEGQDARVIRRFMDQAAFRARQESGVVLLGRVRADTISALILWGTANRAGQVALVPVTAILKDQ